MLEEEVEAYRKLVEEFSDVFVWSYEELKGILQHMVKHRIPLIHGQGRSDKKRGGCTITVVGDGGIIKIIEGMLHEAAEDIGLGIAHSSGKEEKW